MKYCIVCGTPHDGFVVVGPFNQYKDASEYFASDPEFPQGNAWIVDIFAPSNEKEDDQDDGLRGTGERGT